MSTKSKKYDRLIENLIDIIDSFEIDPIKTKEIFQYTVTGELIDIFTSVDQAEQITGVNKICIYKCLNGNTKKAGGYIWKYT